MNTQALLLAVICGTITCGTAAPDPQANPIPLTSNRSITIATVDMQELFKHYYRTSEAQQQINIERTRIQKDNNQRLDRIREIEASLANLHRQIDDPSVADSRKQILSREFNAQQQDLAALDRERREFLQRRNQALNENMVLRMRGILEEIRTLVAEQARTDDFDFVFDKSGLSTSQVPFLLYAKDATDITSRLLKDLNRNAPPGFTPTNSSPATAPIINAPEMPR